MTRHSLVAFCLFSLSAEMIGCSISHVDAEASRGGSDRADSESGATELYEGHSGDEDHGVGDGEPHEVDCDSVFRDPVAASDDAIFECGLAQELGQCLVTGSCPTCACENYVKVTTQCDAGGLCGAPLSGTGCANYGYYAGEHEGVIWNCDQEDPRDVSVCMLRQLLEWGECGAPPPPTPCELVLADPYAASDEVVLNCGLAQELGQCVATGTCETCACENYVKLLDDCTPEGSCPNAPLSGTGCASAVYYGGDHEGTVWNCNQATSEGVAACMLRRLIEWGECV